MSLTQVLSEQASVPCGAYMGPSFPLSFLKDGESGMIEKISGNEEVRKHLAGLGFVTGTIVKVVHTINGNMILNVKESRIAIDVSLAAKIKCSPTS